MLCPLRLGEGGYYPSIHRYDCELNLAIVLQIFSYKNYFRDGHVTPAKPISTSWDTVLEAQEDP